MLFDAQLLFGTDDWLARNKPSLAHRLDESEALAQMEAAAEGGEWCAALFPFPSAPGQTYASENARVIRAAQAEPRFLAVAAINPNVPENVSAVEEAAEKGEIAGLAVWPILCQLDLVELQHQARLWRLAERYDLPVTVHVGTGAEPDLGRAVERGRYAPMDAARLARALPQIRFNLSHCLRLSREALELVATLENVWTDTSGLSAIGRWREAGQEVFLASDALDVGEERHYVIVRLIRDYGLEGRILFASSYPFSAWWHFDVSDEARACRRQPLGEDALSALLWNNACEFYKENK